MKLVKVGTIVKIKSDLEVNTYYGEGLCFNESMGELRGREFKVVNSFASCEGENRFKLEGDASEWTWNLNMIEEVCEEDMIEQEEVCAICGETLNEDNRIWVECENRYICEDCYSDSYFTCDDCGATKTEQIEKLTVHTYGNWVKTNNTIHKRTCECGASETKKHVFTDWVTTKEATENEVGIKEKTCVCGYSITEEIPKIVIDENLSNSPEESTNKQAADNSDSSESTMLPTIIIISVSVIGITALSVITYTIIKKKKRNK